MSRSEAMPFRSREPGAGGAGGLRRGLGRLALAVAVAGGVLFGPGRVGEAEANDLGRPDAHAPIGVMGDHVHAAGEWMLSYRFMFMRMDGNRSGTHDRSTGEVLRPGGDFLVAPLDMDVQMHMLGAMYAPTDRVTLTAMLPLLVKSMDHRTAQGEEFTTRSTGLADVSVSALVKLFEVEHHEVHANLGVSFPTGSIDRKDDTPASMGANTQLPYPMQLGSGTVDLWPGLTYNGQVDHFSWGAQAMGTVRLGRNDENYRLGNRYGLTGWLAARPLGWLSLAGRVAFDQWFDIEGSDDRIRGVEMMGTTVPPEQVVPTADPDRRAGRRLQVGPSLNLYAPSGPLKGTRFGVEFLVPVYQDLDGPQLQSSWTLSAGFQYSF
ncbi:MAG: transporter [Myxococcota bacterium]